MELLPSTVSQNKSPTNSSFGKSHFRRDFNEFSPLEKKIRDLEAENEILRSLFVENVTKKVELNSAIERKVEKLLEVRRKKEKERADDSEAPWPYETNN